jgi:hypothetical protein
LYLFNPVTKSLESVPSSNEREPLAVSVERPPEGMVSAAVRCFVQRAPIHIPDLRRDASVNPSQKKGIQKSALFAPVLFAHEAAGVIETLSTRRLGSFNRREQALIQHLALQTGASLAIQDQKKLREQIVRSEKLAATGQLISDAAGDLRPSLDRILTLSSAAGALLEDRILTELRTEAQRAVEMVARLVSFAGPENMKADQIDVNAILNQLIQFRAAEWTTRGIRIQNHLSPEPAIILGQRGQIERAFLDLTVQAEHYAASSSTKVLSISSSLIDNRILVEIGCRVHTSIEETNLQACRMITQNHGGELRYESRSDESTLAIEFPLAAGIEPLIATSRSRSSTGRRLTLMLVESDLAARQQLVNLLSRRGHRVVPVGAEEAPVLAQRLRFDAVVWAVRPGGSKWSDSQQRLRDSIPAFILVSGGYDEAFASSLAEGGGFLLRRPVEENDLDQVLDALESRAPAQV